MKQLFFQKGQKQQFSPNGEYFVETSSNLDSKKYILERIPMQVFTQQQHYIENHFYFSREDNLISYFNCWKQKENVPIQKPTAKEKQKKKQKKTMLDLMKRKAKIENQQNIAPSKKKIVEDSQNQNFTVQQFLYVQMEYFSEIQIPNDFSSCRDMLVIIYLLGRNIEKKTGSIPCLIPVKNQENDRIKFYKKGVSLQIELCKLMLYLFKDKQEIYLKQWSQVLENSVRKAMINRDQHLVGGLLKNQIDEFISQNFSIYLMKQEQKVFSIETVKIIDFQTLLLEQSSIELPLSEYSIEYLLKSENDRQVTLTHQVFEKYTMLGKKSNLIVKWLFHMAT